MKTIKREILIYFIFLNYLLYISASSLSTFHMKKFLVLKRQFNPNNRNLNNNMPATFNNQTPPYPQKENSIIGLKNFNVYCKTGLLQGVKFFTPSSQNYAYKFACNENAGDLTNNHSYFAKTS